jgi:hypothetical protein
MKVFDGGADGDVFTNDNTLFDTDEPGWSYI